MKKHSKFLTRNEATIKSLLQQLTLREIESEQVKISQLINRQKENKESLRSLKTSHQDHETPGGRNRRGTRRETTQEPASTQDFDKENKLLPLFKKVSVNAKKCEKQRNGDQKNSKLIKDIGKGERKQIPSQAYPVLPEIARLSKRNSIQNSERCLDVSRVQLHSQSGNSAKLAIIQQMEQLCKGSRAVNHKQQRCTAAYLIKAELD